MGLFSLLKRSWRKAILFGLVLLVLMGGLGWLGLQRIGLLTRECHQGYYGPALSADGQSVWYFQRNASGLAVGMSWPRCAKPMKN